MTRRTVLISSFASALASAADKENWSKAASLIEAQTSTGAVTAASLHVQHGRSEWKRGFGQARTPDAVFLLASITKPMTASAVMILSDRKMLSISDPVERYIPEFTGGERGRVTIKHL